MHATGSHVHVGVGTAEAETRVRVIGGPVGRAKSRLPNVTYPDTDGAVSHGVKVGGGQVRPWAIAAFQHSNSADCRHSHPYSCWVSAAPPDMCWIAYVLTAGCCAGHAGRAHAHIGWTAGGAVADSCGGTDSSGTTDSSGATDS